MQHLYRLLTAQKLGSICKVVEDHLMERYVDVTVGQTDLGFSMKQYKLIRALIR